MTEIEQVSGGPVAAEVPDDTQKLDTVSYKDEMNEAANSNSNSNSTTTNNSDEGYVNTTADESATLSSSSLPSTNTAAEQEQRQYQDTTQTAAATPTDDGHEVAAVLVPAADGGGSCDDDDASDDDMLVVPTTDSHGLAAVMAAANDGGDAGSCVDSESDMRKSVEQNNNVESELSSPSSLISPNTDKHEQEQHVANSCGGAAAATTSNAFSAVLASSPFIASIYHQSMSSLRVHSFNALNFIASKAQTITETQAYNAVSTTVTDTANSLGIARYLPTTNVSALYTSAIERIPRIASSILVFGRQFVTTIQNHPIVTMELKNGNKHMGTSPLSPSQQGNNNGLLILYNFTRWSYMLTQLLQKDYDRKQRRRNYNYNSECY